MDEIGDVLGALYIYHIFGPLHVKPSMYARNNIEEINTTTEMRLQSLNRSWTWYIEILSNMKTEAIVLVAKQKSYICQVCAQRNIFLRRISWDKYLKFYGVAVIGATFAFCWCSDSESSFVSAQEITATRARVGHLLHAVHTARDASTRPESYEAEKSSNNPGYHAWLWLGLSCHVGLTMRTCHCDRPVSETRSCHILNLSHHLDWSLGLLWCRIWGGRRRSSLLSRQARVHLSRRRWRGKATSSTSGHGVVIGGRSCRHSLLVLRLIHRRGTHSK